MEVLMAVEDGDDEDGPRWGLVLALGGFARGDQIVEFLLWCARNTPTSTIREEKCIVLLMQHVPT